MNGEVNESKPGGSAALKLETIPCLNCRYCQDSGEGGREGAGNNMPFCTHCCQMVIWGFPHKVASLDVRIGVPKVKNALVGVVYL